jgi:adenosylhomocysteine nucleosidase
MALAALAGLEAEARILRRLGVPAETSGADPARAERLAARLLAEGADAILSFGIAGALAPGLAPGTILLPRRVVTEAGERYAADETLRDGIARRLTAMGVPFEERDLLGRDAIAATAAEKSNLFRRTGAVAVDLESHAAARAASRAGKDFAALRAVADPAAFDLPPAALVGLGRDGRPALLPVLGALARAPAQLPALIRLALLTRAALRTLSRSAPALLGSP